MVKYLLALLVMVVGLTVVLPAQTLTTDPIVVKKRNGFGGAPQTNYLDYGGFKLLLFQPKVNFYSKFASYAISVHSVSPLAPEPFTLQADLSVNQHNHTPAGTQQKIAHFMPDTVGVLRMSQSVKVFPNPASDKVTIAFEQPLNQPARLNLYNILGEQLMNTVIEPGSVGVELALKSVPNGTYIAKIQVDKSEITQKILVRH